MDSYEYGICGCVYDPEKDNEKTELHPDITQPQVSF